ncbi:MAG: acyl carrier protein [Clostridia bacterium]|nr:acyl carrier protein [Clostridia bacterium]
MREEIMEILANLRPDVDFENEKKLITDGILESFDIVAILGELNDAFDIEVRVGDLVPDNFNSVDGMVALVKAHREED